MTVVSLVALLCCVVGTRSTVNTDTPQSSRRRIYKDEESDSNDDKELPLLSEDLDEPERMYVKWLWLVCSSSNCDSCIELHNICYK